MKQVENDEFLLFLENELIKNFYVSENIVNAGKQGHGVKQICFYTVDGKPSNSYVSFCENVFNELIVAFYTTDEALIKDVFAEIKRIKSKYKKIRLGFAENDFCKSDLFKRYFKVTNLYKAEYPVFACFNKSDVPCNELPVSIKIITVKNPEKSEYASYSDEKWDGLAAQIACGLCRDNDLLFVICENEAVCGYLLANNTYKNIYDISNVFVSEENRGNNYGKYLTVYYANYCFDNGFIPHYGSAVSVYSENVARKSGFNELGRMHYVDVKIKLFVR